MVEGFFENMEKQVRTRSHQNDVSTAILPIHLQVCLNPFFLTIKYNHVSPDDVALHCRTLLRSDTRYPAFSATRCVVCCEGDVSRGRVRSRLPLHAQVCMEVVVRPFSVNLGTLPRYLLFLLPFLSEWEIAKQLK